MPAQAGIQWMVMMSPHSMHTGHSRNGDIPATPLDTRLRGCDERARRGERTRARYQGA
jgi:hypothetical protein